MRFLVSADPATRDEFEDYASSLVLTPTPSVLAAFGSRS